MREIINVGATPNDNSGDTLRAAGQKMNANFAELYDWTGAASNLAFRIPSGTTEQRPGVPQKGHIRYNSSTEVVEAYIGSPPSWQTLSFGFTAGNFVRIAGENNLGPMTWTQGAHIKFGHSFELDTNDGRIGAGLFQPGLNIVGTRTVSGEERRMHLWGRITSEGSFQMAGRAAPSPTGWVSAQNGGFNTVTIDGGASAGTLLLNGPTATSPAVTLAKGGNARWLLRARNDAGSDFLLERYNASGVYVDVPFAIASADGKAMFTLAQIADLTLSRRAGNAGGILRLENPATGTAIQGNVSVDVVGDQLRIFESAGTNRGFFLNIAGGSAGVATEIWHTNNFNPANYLARSGGSMTGALALAGVSTAPTAGQDTNTTQIATTAFVLGQAGTITPLTSGTAAVGASLRYAREDHVHPRDTGVLALSGGTMTGPLTLSGAPTAANHAATRAYVDNAFSAATGGPGGVIDRVLRTGDTMTGQLNLDYAAPFVVLNKAANNAGVVRFNSGGNIRWDLQVDSVAETGSNAGSDFSLRRFADNGAYLGEAFWAQRSTGHVYFRGLISVDSTGNNAEFYLRKTGGGTNTSSIWGQNLSGQSRWRLDVGAGDAESGANTGSSFQIHRYSDAGSYIGTPLTIFRANGIAVFENAIALRNNLQIASTTSEGGQLILNYPGNGSVSGTQGNSTWNVDVDGGNGFRIFSHNAAGVVHTHMAIGPDAAGEMNVYSSLLRLNHASRSQIQLNKSNADGESVVYGQRNGVLRWALVLGTTAQESTANVGSDFALARFNDAGAWLGNALTINRASGGAAFSNDLFVGENLYISRAAGTAHVILDAPTGELRRLLGRRAGVDRWVLDLGMNDAETGSNSGTSFRLGRYADNGAYLGDVFTIDRASGTTTFVGALNAQTPTGSSNVTTKSYVDGQVATRFPNSGGVVTGDLAINKSWPSIVLNKTGSGQGAQIVGRNNGGERWQLLVGDDAAESGGNAGSRFSLQAWADDGTTWLGTRMTIERTGAVWFGGTVEVATPTAGGHATTKTYVDGLVNSRLPLAGGTMTGGLSFGSASVTNPWDLSRHISLWGTGFGFSITNNSMNIVVGATNEINFWHNNSNTARVEAGGTSAPNAISLITREKGDARYVPLSGAATMTNWLQIQSAAPTFFLDKTSTSGHNNRIEARRNGITQWLLDLGNDEVGNHFRIHRFNDAGVSQGDAVKIWRDTNAFDVSGRLSVAGNEIHLSGGAPTLRFLHPTNRQGFIHVHTDRMYFLTGTAGSGNWSQVDGMWPLYLDLTNNDATFGRDIFARGYYARGGAGLTSPDAYTDGTAWYCDTIRANPNWGTGYTVALRAMHHPGNWAGFRMQLGSGGTDFIDFKNGGHIYAPANVNVGSLTSRGNINSDGDIGLNKAWPTLALNKAASGQVGAILGKTNGSDRWALRLGSDHPETGSNAGSDFQLFRCTDAGAYIDEALYIRRSDAFARFIGRLEAGFGFRVPDALGANAWDVARHLDLFAGSYGLAISPATLNVVTGGVVDVRQGSSLMARVAAAGTSAPDAQTVMTREKGDARYVQSASIPIVELAARVLISGTPTFVEFALPTGYIRYDFTFCDIGANITPGLLGFQLSRDNGATWQSGSTDYNVTYQTSLSNYHGSGASGAFGQLSVSQGANFLFSGRMSLYASPANNRHWLYESSTVGVTASPQNYDVAQFAGAAFNSTTRFNRIRFFWNGGTFSNSQGSISIHGVRQ